MGFGGSATMSGDAFGAAFASEPIVSWARALVAPINFTTAAQSNNVFTGLPAWLQIACATTGRTVQTSAATYARSLGANAWRARSVDGSTFGLSVECARTNQTTNSALNTWTTNGTIAVTSATDPTGASTSCSVNDNDGAAAAFILATFAVAAGSTCASVWEKIIGTSSSASRVNTNVTGLSALDRTGTDAAWGRYDLTGTASSGSFNSVIQPRITAAQTGSVLIDGYQIEAGKYPSSVIPIVGGVATARAADVLSSAVAGSVLVRNGYPNVVLTFAPNYANTEQASDHDLVFFDSNNRLFVQQSTSKIVWRIGGADVLSSALTWSRNQAITVTAIHSPSRGRILIVTGATTGSGTSTGTVVSAITAPATVYMLGNASGAQECADLRAIGFYRDAA